MAEREPLKLRVQGSIPCTPRRKVISMYKRFQTSPKPAVCYPVPCGLGGDCTYQTHPKDYLTEDVVSSLCCFIDNDSREVNTFRATVVFWPYNSCTVIVILDDDDTHLSLRRLDSSEEEARRIASYLNRLAYIDPSMVVDQFEQLGWKFD